MSAKPILLGVLGVVALAIVGVAGGRALESQPAFCASCHEARPIYDNWLASGAAEDHGTCIECHTAPGLGGIVDGQMRGAVHAFKHVTGTFRTPLEANVPDAFCLHCHALGEVQREHDEIAIGTKACAECHNHKPGASFSGEEEGREDGAPSEEREGGQRDRSDDDN